VPFVGLVEALEIAGSFRLEPASARRGTMSESSPSFEAAVAALTRYFVGNQTLGESLHQVADLCLEVLPQVDHVGITLLVDGKLKTSVFTHPEVPEIDQAQYRTGEGPCIDAYRNGAMFMIDSTLEPGRWQAFRDSASRHRVLSTMSLPLITHDGPIGALNMYAEAERAFGDDDRHMGELFAAQAAFLLANAQAYWDARTLSENLEQAMLSRAAIEQAKGIIMNSVGCGPDEAIQILIRQSQDQNVKLRDLAEELVRNADRRVR
jgi:GAF domain-containing protein